MTALLIKVANGNQAAQEKLVPSLYDQLKKLARRYMRRERSEHTLDPLLWFMKLISNWLASILPTGRTAPRTMGLLPN